MPVVADNPGKAPMMIPNEVPAIMAMTFGRVNAWTNPTEIS